MINGRVCCVGHMITEVEREREGEREGVNKDGSACPRGVNPTADCQLHAAAAAANVSYSQRGLLLQGSNPLVDTPLQDGSHYT